MQKIKEYCSSISEDETLEGSQTQLATGSLTEVVTSYNLQPGKAFS